VLADLDPAVARVKGALLRGRGTLPADIVKRRIGAALYEAGYDRRTFKVYKEDQRRAVRQFNPSLLVKSDFFTKGDALGHDFHGNQWTGGGGRITATDIKFDSGGDGVPGGYNGYFVAYDKNTGDKLGYIDYQTATGDKSVLISMVKTEPEHRGKGVGLALVQRLQDEFSGGPHPDIPSYLTDRKTIEWGMMTDEGAKLKEAWERQAPKVAKNAGHRLVSADFFRGDVTGHEFHGNQWTGGIGNIDAKTTMPGRPEMFTEKAKANLPAEVDTEIGRYYHTTEDDPNWQSVADGANARLAEGVPKMTGQDVKGVMRVWSQHADLSQMGVGIQLAVAEKFGTSVPTSISQMDGLYKDLFGSDRDASDEAEEYIRDWQDLEPNRGILQDREVFGTGINKTTPDYETLKAWGNATVDETYDRTQAYFKAHAITEVPVYRGITLRDEPEGAPKLGDGWKETQTKSWPATSWSASLLRLATSPETTSGRVTGTGSSLL